MAFDTRIIEYNHNYTETSEGEMTELEKLHAENKILRAEKEGAEMEASFLKDSQR